MLLLARHGDAPLELEAIDEPTTTASPLPPTVPTVRSTEAASAPTVHAQDQLAHPSLSTPGLFHFVIGGRVVLNENAPEELGKGRIVGHYANGVARAWRGVDQERLSEAQRSLAGAAFDVYGVEGKLCTAQLGPLRVSAHAPQWDWYDHDAQDEEGSQARDPKPTAEELAGIYEEGQRWLVASLGDDPACRGAVWARDASLPAPTILRPTRAKDESTALAARALRGSDGFHERRTEFAEWWGSADEYARNDQPDWETMDRRGVRTLAWRDEAGETRAVSLRFGHDGSNCGSGHDARIYRLFDVDSGNLQVNAPAPAVFDLNGDGVWETYHRAGLAGGVLRTAAGDHDREAYIDAYYGCGC